MLPAAIRKYLGFSILLNDTLTCSQGSGGFEPATFQLLDDQQLCLLLIIDIDFGDPLTLNSASL